MNLALIIGQRPATLNVLGEKLTGLGLNVSMLPNVSALGNGSIAPRVLLLDADASDALLEPLPAHIAAVPIRLAISPFGTPIAGVQRIIRPPATEEVLIRTLLDAGYRLPAEAECSAIRTILHDLTEGDGQLVLELVDSLIITAESDLDEYLAYCAKGDWAAAGSLAHRIKGTTRTAGCASLSRVCERIESAARADAGSTLKCLNQIFEPGVLHLCTALRELRQSL